MPLFEFKCTKCNWKGERFVKYSNENRELICEECGALVEKQVSMPGKGQVK